MLTCTTLRHHSANHQLQCPSGWRACVVRCKCSISVLSCHNSLLDLIFLCFVEHLRADDFPGVGFLGLVFPFEHSKLLHLCDLSSDSNNCRIPIQDFASVVVMELTGCIEKRFMSGGSTGLLTQRIDRHCIFWHGRCLHFDIWWWQDLGQLRRGV